MRIGVTRLPRTGCRARITFRSKFLVEPDGGNSLVVSLWGLPFDGKMGVGGSMNTS